MTLRSVAHSVILSWGVKRAAIAFVAGAASALAMAPFALWPIIFLTFPVAVWLIDGAGAGRLSGLPAAAAAGWWFGFGYFLAGLYWVGNAFLVDADIFGWLMPIAVAGLPAGLALFTAAGFALARALWTADASRILAFALALTTSEWLRGHILSGFPWNAFGYALAEPPMLAQSASVFGLWGLTFVALATGASAAALVDDATVTRHPRRPLVLAVLVLAAMAGFGWWRLDHHPTRLIDTVTLRLMQPNIQQNAKFNYSAKDATLATYLDLSDRATGPSTSGVKDATILIWPESAFPFFLTREADAMARIADLLPPGTTLITGAVRAPETPPGQPIRRAYNSIYVIGHDGTVLAAYDKMHLVPFGEYLPFQATLEKLGLEQLTRLQGGYIPGTRRRAIALPTGPRVLPLVCYEVIFPGAISTPDDRPGWIVNLTNDAWFGQSPGPYQHLQQARLRAIEEGLPIVRVANSGISAVIDPLGRVLSQLPLGTAGVLDSPLPQAITMPPYPRMRDLPLALVGMVLAVGLMRRHRRNRS